jgi:hypothetical protein
MQTFPKHHIILLPHAEEYRAFYKITLNEIGEVLSAPETVAGLSDSRYTAEKTLGKKRIAVFYYQTLPMNGRPDEPYAVVDFIGLRELSL